MNLRGAMLLALCGALAPLPALSQSAGQRPQPRPALTEPAPKVTPPGASALPRPAPRPTQVQEASAPAQAATTPRPQPRPNRAPTEQMAAAPLPQGMARSPRPLPRPTAPALAQAQAPAAPDAAPETTLAAAPAAKPSLLQRLFGTGGQAKAPQSSAPRQGSVCGDRAIRGQVVAPVTSKVRGCGIADPVRVTEVSGIRLSQPVTVECGTVVALKDWIDRAMRPAFGPREVVELRIAAHYICRGRNNKRHARISEHGKGRALDIAGFVFADGTEWSIRRDYNKQVRRAHRDACGIFGTTLGPGSDGYHEDHLHFDIARYRNGPYCR